MYQIVPFNRLVPCHLKLRGKTIGLFWKYNLFLNIFSMNHAVKRAITHAQNVIIPL